MKIVKLPVTVLFCAALLLGCGAEEPGIQTDKVEREQSQTQSITAKPVRGIVRGQEFKIEQATLRDNTLTLRQGKNFFADSSIDIVLSGYDSLENRAIKVEPKTGFASPHLRLGIMKESEGLPDETMVMSGYTMELVFDKASELGIPFFIKLVINGVPRTDVKGKYFATYDDIRLDDGKVDLTYDSFDTLRHIARRYLKTKYRDMELTEDFSTSYKSYSEADYPKTGFIGYESVTGGSPLIVKLQLFKDQKGWRVANQLAENQIDQAHPLDEQTGKDEHTILASRARKLAAMRLENYLNEHTLMPGVRSTSVGCYTSRDLARASCRAVYGLKDPDEVACMNKNYLLVRNGGSWHIEREITDTEKVDHATGELVTYKPFSMNCT